MLESYGLITGVSPVDGWSYIQDTKDGPQRIPVTGDAGGDALLVEQVRDYRITNNIPMGDVMWDVADQIIKRSPQNDKYKRGGVSPHVKSKAPKAGYVPPIERIRDWLHQMTFQSTSIISDYDAEQRVPICAACPHNVEWKTGCAPCVTDVKLRGQNLRQRAISPGDGLNFCRLHGVFLPSAVHLDGVFTPHPEQPEPCWVR